jgi:hypothetical protein
VPLLEDGGIEAFIRREVLPYTPDAWIRDDATKIGYEISFTRHFYKPQPLRTLEEISADILAIEKEAEGLLDGLLKVVGQRMKKKSTTCSQELKPSALQTGRQEHAGIPPGHRCLSSWMRRRCSLTCAASSSPPASGLPPLPIPPQTLLCWHVGVGSSPRVFRASGRLRKADSRDRVTRIDGEFGPRLQLRRSICPHDPVLSGFPDEEIV